MSRSIAAIHSVRRLFEVPIILTIGLAFAAQIADAINIRSVNDTPETTGTAQPQVTPEPRAVMFSPSTREVLKLLDAKLPNDVVVAYVKTAVVPFNLGAKEIIALRDEGVSPEIIKAMVERGGELRKERLQALAAQPAPTPQSPLPAQAPAVAPTLMYQQPYSPPLDYSAFDYIPSYYPTYWPDYYSYAYPYYGYGFSYSFPLWGYNSYHRRGFRGGFPHSYGYYRGNRSLAFTGRPFVARGGFGSFHSGGGSFRGFAGSGARVGGFSGHVGARGGGGFHHR